MHLQAHGQGLHGSTLVPRIKSRLAEAVQVSDAALSMTKRESKAQLSPGVEHERTCRKWKDQPPPIQWKDNAVRVYEMESGCLAAAS